MLYNPDNKSMGFQVSVNVAKISNFFAVLGLYDGENLKNRG